MSLSTGDLSEGAKQAGDTNADDETAGANGSAKDLGNLFISGADEDLTISIKSDVSGLPTLFSKGEAVHYSVNAAGTVLTGFVDVGAANGERWKPATVRCLR